ncbi:MAG: HD domain-containing protein [Bdellovibrionaceae bacterium]|nr:HD domain-containing protein [Pseudobdellovibrionaceae bacterium]
MEIRDPVHGSISLSSAETAVIETPEYQRLRSIKQLGFAEFSFPGATHNRFLHSIGVSHVAGAAFDQIFKNFTFAKSSTRQKFRAILKAGALLHDVGHGPLSHTTEEVMPPLKDLNIQAYKHKKLRTGESAITENRPANHEDYTIKYLTDSPLTQVLNEVYPEFTPLHLACLIDKSMTVPDDFFIEQGIDFRPILSQLVSSELDCDRMDYLERDSYFCGTNYGKVDLHWLMNNMAAYLSNEKLYLGISRRALYTFDDFLISRHHMHLMVYFHHKSIIYEEMLNLYLTSKDCTFFLPSDINEYTKYNDYRLFEHLANSKNPWAERIAQRRPYRVLVELHHTDDSPRPKKMKAALEAAGIDVIWSSSAARLSKYHSMSPEDKAYPIYVVDQYDKLDKPAPIDESTEIFQKYEGARIIDRLYVSPENYAAADKILTDQRL